MNLSWNISIITIILVWAPWQSNMVGLSNQGDINLSHWKLTLPIDVNKDGKPDEYKPTLLNKLRSTNDLKPFFYEEGGKMVFFCSVAGSNATTQNSKYPRSELREQIVPGKNNVNWTMEQGGKMFGRLQVSRISPGHRTIVMQIHGRLSKEQKDLLGSRDNDAPPLLKIYHEKGRIRVARKVMVDSTTTGEDLLPKKSWRDGEKFYFEEPVGYQPFNLEVIASKGRLEVKLNGKSKIFEDKSMQRWDFENYFKAGNYLQTLDPNGFAEVKYHSLSVKH